MELTEIQPTYMENPSKIWFLKKPDEAFETYLTNTMKANELLGCRGGRNWHTPSVGEMVMIWCRKENVWCRAQILEIFTNSMSERNTSVTVFLFDYGTPASASIVDVRQLPLIPEFRVPGKACKLMLHGIVPITKKRVFIEEKSIFKNITCYAKKWDLSTYDFMANILSTTAKFYLKIHHRMGTVNDLENETILGDLYFLVNGVPTSAIEKLGREKYGAYNTDKFTEFLDFCNEKLSTLCLEPDKPIHAKVWQIDFDKLVTQHASKLEDAIFPDETNGMDPFESSPEEVELVRKAAQARADESRVEGEKAQAIEEYLLEEKRVSEELKLKFKPARWADRIKYLAEETRLKNSAKELGGVIMRTEEFSNAKDFVVHYRTLYKPTSLFVTIAENTDAFETLQEEIACFTSRHKSLIGQVVLKAGAYCLALYPEEKVWYRARLISFKAMRQVEVFYVDVGDDAQLDGYSEIMPISRPLIEMLPFQAIECSLYGIQPVNTNDWSEESMEAVSKYCLNKEGDSVNLQVEILGHTQAEYSDGKKSKVVLTRSHQLADQVLSLNKTLLELPSVELNPEEPLTN